MTRTLLSWTHFFNCVQFFSKCLVCILSVTLFYSLLFFYSWISSTLLKTVDTRDLRLETYLMQTMLQFHSVDIFIAELAEWAVLFWRWIHMKIYNIICRFLFSQNNSFNLIGKQHIHDTRIKTVPPTNRLLTMLRYEMCSNDKQLVVRCAVLVARARSC